MNLEGNYCRIVNSEKRVIRYIIGFAILVAGVLTSSFSNGVDVNIDPVQTGSSRIESFTFMSSGIATKGKIYLPGSYGTDKDLPAIYLIDFTEQHFKIATDEFEKVIEGVEKLLGFDALVVSLENILDVDAEPESFQEHFEVYKNLVSYVDNIYTNNLSRTFIGKGSESGVVLMALFLHNSEASLFDNFIVTDPSPKYASAIINLIENDDFPVGKSDKKLHFSFSVSNDREKCIHLINLIENANYEWLQLESKEYTTSDYENTYPVSYAEGIKYVFNK